MKESKNQIIFYTIYLFVYGLVIFMLWPYISVLVFAAILSGVFMPVYHLLVNKLRWNGYLSAFLICFVIFILVGLPVVYFLSHMIGEAVGFFTQFRSLMSADKFQKWFSSQHVFTDFLKRIFALVNLEYRPDMLQTFLIDSAKNLSSYVLNTINLWVSNLLYLLWQFVIMLILTFSILTYNIPLRKFIKDVLPLPSDEVDLLFLKFKQINYATFVTNAVGGIIQGLLAGIAFYIVGIKSPIFWIIFMTVLAFIPVIGISIVYIPASIYLYLFDTATWKSIFLVIFCTCVALWVEQWFKPKFMGKRTDTNAILILLSILAGMSQFGVLGIFYGPLVVSVFLTFVELYKKRKNQALDL